MTAGSEVGGDEREARAAPAGWDADTIADALDVLAAVPAWELSPQRWDRVRLILDRMAAVITGGDAQDLRDAVAELQLSGPRRIRRVGSDVRTGVPDQVVQRVDKLVHALTPPGPKDSRDAERPR